MVRLRYGNTDTYFIGGAPGGLLLDTDWAGTLPGLRRALKAEGLTLADVRCLMVTHFHPDHMGLVGELQTIGVPVVAADVQKDFLHAADGIFQKENNRAYVPPDDARVRILPCADSRAFLSSLGIRGEIVPTPGHSDDSVSLVLDDGTAFVGDLPPYVNVPAYGNPVLEQSWSRLRGMGVSRVYYSHF